MAKPLPASGTQRVEIDVFDRHAQLPGTILPAAALGLACASPIGRSIASPLEALPIDKGFDQMDGVAVSGLPIVGQPPRNASQDMAGQVRHLDPRQAGHTLPIIRHLSRFTTAVILSSENDSACFVSVDRPMAFTTYVSCPIILRPLFPSG